MGESEKFEDIDASYLARQVYMLTGVLGPSRDAIFTKNSISQGTSGIDEYNEWDFKSSPDIATPDRKLVKILFDDETSAVICIDTQSEDYRLIKAFKATNEGVSIITPGPENSPLHKIELKPDSSREAIAGYLKDLHIGTPVKPVKRYLSEPRRKVS